MLLITFNVIYVLIALAMIVLVLLQRGSGAQAGSGFGSGASGTVFGARGAATFLTRSTAVLAGLFFVLSLGMGIYLSRGTGVSAPVDDLGVMSGTDVPAKPPAAVTPPVTGDVPKAPATDAAATPAPAGDKPAAPPATPAAPAAKKADAKDHKPDESKNKQG